MSRALCLALLGVAACSGDGDAPRVAAAPRPRPVASFSARPVSTAATAPSALPPPAPPLTFTVDGKPIHIVSAVAVASDNDEIEVEVTDFEYGCEGLLSRVGYPKDGDTWLQLRLGKQLRPNGELVWALRASSYGGSFTETQGSGDALLGATIDPTAGARGKLPMNLEHTVLLSGGEHGPKLVLKGDLEVLGCGKREWLAEPPPPPVPQPDAFITIAGRELPIVGAAISERDGHRTLLVSDAATLCDDSGTFASSRGHVSISVSWDKEGKIYNAIRDGYWVGWGVLQQAAVDLTVSPTAVPKGKRELTVTLGGTATVDEYPVALRGQVRAEICRKKSR
jgi:hypothetical protein